MTQDIRQKLIQRMENTLDNLGIYTADQKQVFLEKCQKMELDKLGSLAADFRIRLHLLQKLSENPDKRNKIHKTAEHLRAVFNKYGINP